MATVILRLPAVKAPRRACSQYDLPPYLAGHLPQTYRSRRPCRRMGRGRNRPVVAAAN